MAPNAVFLALSGVILRDRSLRQQLLDDLLLVENLRPDPKDYGEVCGGRGDRTCLQRLLARRGRVVTGERLDQLLALRSSRYQAALAAMDRLPLYPGLEDFLYQCKIAQIPLGLVTAMESPDVTWVLQKLELEASFKVVITAQDLSPQGDKPTGESYQKAIAQLQTQLQAQEPDRVITPATCLGIESTFEGIATAQAAGVPVVGVAHQYPYQMMQRRATWAVDYLNELDWEWLGRYYPDPAHPLEKA